MHNRPNTSWTQRRGVEECARVSLSETGMVAASRNASLSWTAAATRAKKLPRSAHRGAEAVLVWELRRGDGSAAFRGRQVRGSRAQKTRICRYSRKGREAR